MSIIKKYSLKNSGIKLYRNGFRVLPYGEWGDDWLSLDKSTRRRSILPTHTNQNFFGYVEISDESGDFEETSSREGLLNNEAFVELQNFIYRSLVSAVIKIAEQRNLKIVSGQKQQDDGQWEEINVRVKNIAFTISELDKDFESGQETIEAKAKRRKEIKKLKEENQYEQSNFNGKTYKRSGGTLYAGRKSDGDCQIFLSGKPYDKTAGRSAKCRFSKHLSIRQNGRICREIPA